MAGAPRLADAGIAQFAVDVRECLSRVPRQLPSRYFYDPLGSALFDAICQLPWYRITRSESWLLAQHAAEIRRHLEPLTTIIELGPGNGQKLKLLLESAGRARGPVQVHLVDVSTDALSIARANIATLHAGRVVTHAAEYGEGLREAVAQVPGGGRTLVLFLGSNIGNLDPRAASAFLASVRECLPHRGALLLGTDLVKPAAELLLAYDDPLGVTAAFNRNLLVRINRELGGNFDIRQFRHQALWNAVESRVEAHLVARSDQWVRIDALPMEFSIRAGDGIWTESSYKYEPDGVAAMLDAAKFRAVAQWIDDGGRFALTLGEA